MTHYEVLGIPRNATPAQIKRAYRRAAQTAHPDREGGSAAAMLPIQEAYDCLSDEARRAAYDADDTMPEESIDIAAKMVLADMVADAIKNHAADLQGFLRRVLHKARLHHEQQLADCPRRKLELEKWRGRVVNLRGEPNIVETVIEDELDAVDRDVSTLMRNIEMNARMSSMLDDYLDTGSGGTKIGTTVDRSGE